MLELTHMHFSIAQKMNSVNFLSDAMLKQDHCLIPYLYVLASDVNENQKVEKENALMNKKRTLTMS